jgi:ribonuclease HII
MAHEVAAAPAGATASYRIGVDENGLGPRLGPMIVTAILTRVTPEGCVVARRRPRGALAKRLGDSKEMLSHGDVALGEAWARALVARGCGRGSDRSASSPEAIVEAISADGREALRAPCPTHVEPQCWSTEGEVFTAPDDMVATIAGDLAGLAQKGVDVLAVRSVVLCTHRLNEGASRGQNRFQADLHAMERLVLELAEVAGAEVHAVCGKVGGFDRYSDAFGPLAGRLHAILEEGRARSAYRFPGLGELAFVRDGDASDLVVAMASMVGKYLRELMMARIVRFYRRDDAELPSASGYSDPVTASFIQATRLVRREREVPHDCFERRRVDSDGEPPRSPGP